MVAKLLAKELEAMKEIMRGAVLSSPNDVGCDDVKTPRPNSRPTDDRGNIR
jgi:hypothetical protein